MPYRLDQRYGFRAKVQFTTSSRMPYDIYQACLVTDTPSNTRYIQEAVCEKLARDLGLDLGVLLDALPPPRGPSGHLYDPAEGTMNRYGAKRTGIADEPARLVRIGPANTDEEVR